MVHNFGKCFLCLVCLGGILSVFSRVESREISSLSLNSNRGDEEELEELMSNGNDGISGIGGVDGAQVELSGTDRFKKSVMGLFGLVTQKPHHKAETELAFPPPRDAFLSTRGKKFYPGSGSSSVSLFGSGSGSGAGRHFQQDVSLIPIPSDFRLGFTGDGDWSWKIPAEQYFFSRGRVRGVNSDYIQNSPNF